MILCVVFILSLTGVQQAHSSHVPYACFLLSWSWVIEHTLYSPRCLKHLHLISMNSLPALGLVGWMTTQTLPVIHKGLTVTTGHVALFMSLTTALSSTAALSCLSSSRGLCEEQASVSCCAMCLPVFLQLSVTAHLQYVTKVRTRLFVFRPLVLSIQLQCDSSCREFLENNSVGSNLKYLKEGLRIFSLSPKCMLKSSGDSSVHNTVAVQA